MILRENVCMYDGSYANVPLHASECLISSVVWVLYNIRDFLDSFDHAHNKAGLE